MNILLLAPSYGSGHLISMQGVKQVFDEKGIGYHELDPIRTGGFTDRFSSAFFAFITRKAPQLWILFYPNKITSSLPFKLMYRWLYRSKLANDVAAIKPDIIICNHFSTTLIGSLYKAKHPETKLYAFITDYDAYPLMTWPGVNHYFAGSDRVKAQLRSFGVAEERITVSGIPLRKQFWQVADKLSSREHLGIATNSKVVLFALGTYRSVPVDTILRALKDEPFFPIVLAGKDPADIENYNALFVELKKPGRVLAFTQDIAQLMAASDLYVTKAGGITVSESLACGLPCVFFKSVAGQESANMHYVVNAGGGTVANSVPQVVAAVKALLPEPEKLSTMRYQALTLAKPHAAQTIVECILNETDHA